MTSYFSANRRKSQQNLTFIASSLDKIETLIEGQLVSTTTFDNVRYRSEHELAHIGAFPLIIYLQTQVDVGLPSLKNVIHDTTVVTFGYIYLEKNGR